MKKIFARTAIAAALMAGAAFAQAGTVDLTGWTYGNGNTVNVTAPNENGLAGGFTGSLSGFGAFDTASFTTYCVELTQDFVGPPSGPMTDYSIITGASDTAGFGANAAAISARLGQLMTYVTNTNPAAVTNAAESTSLQLAIWNVIYDTDNTLAGGTFHELATTSYGQYADRLLAASLSVTSDLSVYVATSPTSQDFLVTTPIPEPSTYALMLAGLAGVGFVARRRSQR